MNSSYDLLQLMETLPAHVQKHCNRIGKYVRRLWVYLHGTDGADKVEIAARFHDIGKAYIPRRLLNKPSILDKSEYEIVKKHVEYASRLFLSNKALQYSGLTVEGELRVLMWEMACMHHERWDGTGYPNGRKGIGIPISARICTVLDAYDVMTTGRIYKDRISTEEACEELLRNAGKQFDPRIVIEFIKHKKNFE